MRTSEGAMSPCGECRGKDASCGACWFRPRQQQLEAQFTIADGVTWLHVKWEPFMLGCLVCGAYGSSDGHVSSYQSCTATTRERLKPRSLRAHEDSAKHISALQAWNADSQLDRLARPEAQDEAPTAAEFTKLLDHLRKHPLGRDGVAAVASKKNPGK